MIRRLELLLDAALVTVTAGVLLVAALPDRFAYLFGGILW